jgi:type IV secretion system protein VirB2
MQVENMLLFRDSFKGSLLRAFAICILFFLVFCLIPDHAFAASAGLPWESPLQKVVNSLSGPVAQSIALGAMVIAGATLIMGGELTDFGRKVFASILVLGVLLGATKIIAMYGGAGASI